MRIVAALAIVFVVMTPGAQAADPAAAATCADPAYHALDFWIGRWRVETPAGQPAGTSRVESALSGCVILEHWRGLFLNTGQVQEGLGVHRYDVASKRWRQAWVDETPSTRDTSGHQEGDAVVYDESSVARPQRTRMTLKPIGDGRVEQKGERWDEANQGWQTTFHLIYVPQR
jgi:hypothetical protein